MSLSDTNRVIKPLIDDDYWFRYSEQLVEAAHDTHEKAASRLQTLITWLWTIYTGAATVGLVLSEKHLAVLPTIIIASGSASLVIVYWATVWVQQPVTVEFDPRSPTEIKEAHEQGIRTKDFRLNVTLLLSVLAAVMVSIGLVVSSVSETTESVIPNFDTQLIEEDGTLYVSIIGYVNDANHISIDIVSISDSSIIYSSPITPYQNGIILS